MAVPHVADWCAVDLLEAGGKTRRLAVAHLDPAKVELGWELARRYPPTLGDPRLPLRVLQTGRTELAVHGGDAALAASVRDPEQLAMLRSLGCTSSIVAALSARGRNLGVITFAMAESGRRYTKADIPLVEDLARRSALAVDNARLYREAQQAREEAEAANRAKDRFLAVLSHELRTPLAPVLAEVSAMLDDPATPGSVRPILEMTRRNVELEARLIDDLLDLNRIIQGKLRLDRKVVDAHRLILEALEICRAGIEDARLGFELGLDATRHFVEADAARLQQVAWNLIKNAIKFTPPGGFIAIRTRDEGDKFVLDVSDTGVGIEAGVLSKIFDAFEQGDKSVTQRFGAWGSAWRSAGAWPKPMAAGSTPPAPASTRGRPSPSRCRPSTPRARSPTPTRPASRTPRPRPTARSGSCWSRTITTPSGSWSGSSSGKGTTWPPPTACSPRPGSPRAREFDLLISDLGLADGSGLDLIARLGGLEAGADPGGSPCPATGWDEDVRRSLEAGFLEHLVKPIDFPSLEAAIRRVAAARSVI